MHGLAPTSASSASARPLGRSERAEAPIARHVLAEANELPADPAPHYTVLGVWQHDREPNSAQLHLSLIGQRAQDAGVEKTLHGLTPFPH